ncbi:MAG: prolyl oligopeptidase family serine peptidase [Thermomicrobiales bacterium]
MVERLTPARLVYEMVTAADPRVSPNGKLVVYTLVTADAATARVERQLRLCDTDGGNARALTLAGTSNSSPRWSPGGGTIAYLSDRAGGTGIFVLPMDGGDPIKVTRHDVGIGGLAWSPDGRSLAYTVLVDPANPDEAARPVNFPAPIRVTRRSDYKQDTDNRGFLGDLRSHLWVVEVETGERRCLTDGPTDHLHPAWSPDGRLIAVQLPNRNHICAQLGIVPAAGGGVTVIGPELGVIEAWAWSPGGDRILLAGDTERSWQNDFFIYEAKSRELKRLTTDLECLPSYSWSLYVPPAQPVWLNDREALFAATLHGSGGLFRIDTANGHVRHEHDFHAQISGFGIDEAHRVVAVGSSAPEHAGEIVVFDRGPGAERRISGHNDAVLRKAPPAAVERFQIERGSLTIDCWLLKPHGFDPGKRHPLVIDVHGGPNWWYGDDFGPIRQLLASHGYLVVYANPRGSTSYGREFAQLVTRDWGNEDFQDLMAAVDTVLERPYADRGRTGIYGYSYGGFMSSWTIGQTDRFKAAVIGAPVFDLESFYGTSDIGYVWGVQQFGGTPHEIPEWYRTHSPSTHAHRATTPTLILHGEADERCPIGQGEQLYTALQDAGCEVEFVRYPGQSHLFLWEGEPSYVADFYARTLAWFEGRLG